MIKRFLHIFRIHDWSEWYNDTDCDIRYKFRMCMICGETESINEND